MKLYRSIDQIAEFRQPCVATIGNFDGVHYGHQALLSKLVALSDNLKLPSLVILFEPQPSEFFAKDKAGPRLSRLSEKYQLIKRYQVDRLLCLRFTKQLAQQEATEFVNEVLIKALNISELVVGDDFRFGKNRMGDVILLHKLGVSSGMRVIGMDSINIENNRVSSSRIRQALQEGDLILSKKLLGRDYCITGKVIKGQQKGQVLGVPTINIRLLRTHSPLEGVFVVEVEGDGEIFQGVANIGRRPTVDGKELLLEVHLFNFNRNVYGQRFAVRFLKKLRNEQRFDSLEQLKNQIHNDVKSAKMFFN